MAYGSRSRHESALLSPRRAGGPKGALVLGFEACLCLLLMAACAGGSRESRFATSLAEIDKRLAEGRPAASAFASAARSAGSGADWLSLIARSIRAEEAGDRGRAGAIARKALARAPGVEAVAYGAAYAFLRSGQPAAALALFPSRLSREKRPELWAESFVASARSGVLPPALVEPEALGFLGSALGEPRLYVGAAVLSLERSDGAGAATWLRRAVDAGLEPDASLMWDCGLYEELASRPDTEATPEELCLMGDAAWEGGDFALARQRWERAVSQDPRVSWKAYVKLALLSGEGTELQSSYFARLRASFVDLPEGRAIPEAVAAFAAYRARLGDRSGALALLKPYAQDPTAGALELAIEGLSWPEERLVSEAERFASERPSSGAALGAALRVLFERGRYADMAVIYGAGRARGLDYPYRWYYGAAVAAAQGRYPSAIAELETGSASDTGPEAAFALGTLYGRSGEVQKAIDSLNRARQEAFDGHSRCVVLKELGRVQFAGGDRIGAVASWREAARADPRDPEAALLARRTLAPAVSAAGAGK